MQADDIREKYLTKAAAFVTSSRDSWMKKRHRVINLRDKVGFHCIVDPMFLLELHVACCKIVLKRIKFLLHISIFPWISFWLAIGYMKYNL